VILDDGVALHVEPVRRDRANFIIAADLADLGQPTVRFEQLWARKVTGDTFELCCIPFFTAGLMLGDVVRTRPAGGRRYVVHEVVEPSGHGSYRVWFGDSPDPETTEAKVVQRLEELRCEFEWSDRHFLAIDIPTDKLSRTVGVFLARHERAGRLTFETGYS
jgi:hypothetical protein